LDPPLELKKLGKENNLNEGFVRLSADNTDNLLGCLYEMGYENDDAIFELNDLTEYYDKLPETLKLYRVVFADSEDAIDTQYPGSHYSMNKKQLIKNHYRSPKDKTHGTKGFLIEVEAQKQLIDFYESIKNNILYPHEKEITLKNKGFGAEVIKIGPVYQ
jgi:hypothetical protein